MLWRRSAIGWWSAASSETLKIIWPSSGPGCAERTEMVIQPGGGESPIPAAGCGGDDLAAPCLDPRGRAAQYFEEPISPDERGDRARAVLDEIIARVKPWNLAL